jgi:hypothetical protein
MRSRSFRSGRAPACAILLALVPLLGAFAPPARADVPPLISYQARLTDANGNALNGPFAVRFAIYGTPTAATPLWSESYTNPRLNVVNGVVSVLLGSKESFSSTLFTNSTLYLGIRIENDEEISPRRRIVSSAYALNAALLEGKGPEDFELTGAVADHNTDPAAHPNLSVDATRITGVLSEEQIPDTVASDQELQSHVQDFNNPHNVTLEQGGVIISHFDIEDTGVNTHAQIDTHLASQNNPHQVRRDQLNCPPGTVDAGAYCIEIQRREGAATWSEAAVICRQAGLRLCTPAEWCAACEDAEDLGITDMTADPDWEWIDNWTAWSVSTLNEMRPVAAGFPDCRGLTAFPKTSTYSFRCCQ